MLLALQFKLQASNSFLLPEWLPTMTTAAIKCDSPGGAHLQGLGFSIRVL